MPVRLASSPETGAPTPEANRTWAPGRRRTTGAAAEKGLTKYRTDSSFSPSQVRVEAGGEPLRRCGRLLLGREQPVRAPQGDGRGEASAHLQEDPEVRPGACGGSRRTAAAPRDVPRTRRSIHYVHFYHHHHHPCRAELTQPPKTSRPAGLGEPLRAGARGGPLLPVQGRPRVLQERAQLQVRRRVQLEEGQAGPAEPVLLQPGRGELHGDPPRASGTRTKCPRVPTRQWTGRWGTARSPTR